MRDEDSESEDSEAVKELSDSFSFPPSSYSCSGAKVVEHTFSPIHPDICFCSQGLVA